jgi:magnesium-protoporphyrin O-methyltransferase
MASMRRAARDTAPADAYARRRREIGDYFDRTAADQWARLTSDEPVSGVRRSVRAGRDSMRSTLAGWLPVDLTGRRVLDAGCGTGALAVQLAARGAEVVAVDLSESLLAVAEERCPPRLRARIRFESGDMLSDRLGAFDHAIAMDSLIHYRAAHAVDALAALADRTRDSVLFTYAPRTPMLAVMHAVGRLLPRGDRAPAIEPVGEAGLRAALAARLGGAGWVARRASRVATRFYFTRALELFFAPQRAGAGRAGTHPETMR